MTGIAASGDYGQLARLLGHSSDIRRQLTQANQQTATGRIAETYGGLGTGAGVSFDLRPQIAHQATWQANIDSASVRLEVTQLALKEISQITSGMYAKVNALNGLSPSEADSVATLARSGLERVAQLLNSKVGDVYVFAGQDTGTAPIPDTSPAVLTTALLASDTAAPPFSSTIGTAPPTLEVGEGERVGVGLIANRNTLATSAAPSTGSYMRDIMRGLATLTTLTNGPALMATAADTRTRLSGAMSALALETGTLGDVQAGLMTRKAQSTATVLALTSQVSKAEDVDMAAALTRVTSLQAQLQASYQIIAGMRDLTLSRYL